MFPDKSQWVIGKTKVFLKDKTTEKLEVQRREIYIKAIVKIQTHVRVYHLALKLQVLKEQRARLLRSVIAFQRFIRCWNAKRRFALLGELYNRRMRCIITVQKHIRAFNARRRLLILYRDKLEREKKERERQLELQKKEKEKQLEREKQEQREKQEREKQEREKKEKEKQLEREKHEREKQEREKKEQQEKLRKEESKKQLDVRRNTPESSPTPEEKRRSTTASSRTRDESPYRELDRKYSESSKDNMLRRRNDLKFVCIIQSYIRCWNSKRYAIGLILLKLDGLKVIYQEQEREYRTRLLLSGRDKSKVERKLPANSLHQVILEEQSEARATTDYDYDHRSRIESHAGQKFLIPPKYFGPPWEYSSSDGTNWILFDEKTQEIIEKAYLSAEKEIILTHGVFAKDQYKVVFTGKLSFRNVKSGTSRNLRRGGKECYRVLYKLPPNPNLFVPDPRVRLDSNYKAQRRLQRKASITAHYIENFSGPGFTILYAPEIYYLSPEACVASRESPGRDRLTHTITSPRERNNTIMSPRKYELDLDNSPTLDRTKSRRRFGFQTERTPDKSGTDYKLQSKSSFLPSSKLKYPFRQVSRLWGSQRVRQVPKTPKKNNSLRQFFDVFGAQDEVLPDINQPVNRRKVRSRSVPNLDTLIAMAEQNEELSMGMMSPRPQSTKPKFPEFRNRRNDN
jgi:hypothetical protein